MQKNITHISQEELNSAKQNTNQPSLQNGPKNYVNHLKLKDIKEFFEPFGLIDLQESNIDELNFSAFEVICQNFTTRFSNFEIFTEIDYNSIGNTENPKFDMLKFIEYCNKTDISPELALSQLIQLKLLGQKFHSYNEEYKRKKLKSSKKAFESLPKDMQKLLRPIQDKKEYDINGFANYTKYGTYDNEQEK